MTDIEEGLRKARAAVEAGAFEQAVPVLKGILQTHPQSSDVHLLLGETLAEVGKTDEAIAVLEKGRTVSPHNVALLFALGDACFEAHRIEQALEAYRAIVALAGDGVADALVSIGLVSFQQEQTAEAIRYYREALAHDPESVFALNSLGDALFAQGDADEALKCYRRVIELDPDDAQAHYNLAELYYDLERLEEAAAECRAALALDPELSFAYLTLGNICLDQEQTREALELFQEFLRHERSPAAHDIRNEVAAVIAGLKEEM